MLDLSKLRKGESFHADNPDAIYIVLSDPTEDEMWVQSANGKPMTLFPCIMEGWKQVYLTLPIEEW